MIFTITNPQGAGAMRTEHWPCVPAQKDLQQMNKVGFSFKMDGKKVKPSEIERRRVQNGEKG
jgi:hypothetical protein